MELVYETEAAMPGFGEEINRVFGEIKKHVTLCEYIANFTDSVITRAGAETNRANPCPLCAHNDCFTIYEGNQTFHCFSCGKTGDVIHLEKYIHRLGSNLEAARSLARKFQIAEPIHQEKSKTMNSTTKKKPLSPADDIPQPDARLLALRGIAADYFHGQLLKNQTALDYLLKTRKHSLEVIKHFQIGIDGGNLIAHATSQGYAVSDLENIGLVKKNKRGYSNTIPPGLYVYPHKKAGDVLYFTIKDPGKKRKFQIPKKFAAPGWLCMNQDALVSNSVILVEGEDDLLSVVDKAKQPHVIATIGNFNNKNILDYLKTHSKGKSFYLAFDNDEAGRGYIKKYAAAILEGGGNAHVVDLQGCG